MKKRSELKTEKNGPYPPEAKNKLKTEKTVLPPVTTKKRTNHFLQKKTEKPVLDQKTNEKRKKNRKTIFLPKKE